MPEPASVEEELKLLIRARYPILYLLTFEEDRAEAMLKSAAAALNKKLVIWTVTGQGQKGAAPERALAALDQLIAEADAAIHVLRDFHPYFENSMVTRRVRDAVAELSKSHKTLVLLSPTLTLAPELEKDITIVDFKLPGKKEIGALLDEVLAFAARNPKLSVSLTEDEKNQVVDAALGLTLAEARRVFGKALLDNNSFDSSDIELVLFEKKQLIRKSGSLEYFDAADTVAEVGGLESLKKWLADRRGAFTRRAAEYRLPRPKGLLLLGVQGCGKSLTCKAVARLWGQPLLRLDVGKVFSSYIGSSEENMRRAIATAESLAPVVLWIDEIEKGFSGIKSSSQTDAGVTARIFGAFLTWMQEKTAPVFVVATANSIADLPPELLRKGRFDEIFFIDLPSLGERREILRIHVNKRGRDPQKYALDDLAALADGFSGAELEMAVVEAMYSGFGQGREFSTKDIAEAVTATVPLSRTMAEEIGSLRDWAKTRARMAST